MFDRKTIHSDELFASTPADRRATALRLEKERADERRRALNEQTSMSHDPHERIMIWERLHGLQLPRDEAHPLVDVIAEQTKLSRQEVAQEQARRALGG
jgi:hypothetical protein